VFNIISLVTFLAAVFFLITRGLHFSVEFTGGTLVEINYTHAVDIGKGARRWSRSCSSATCRCRTSAARATCSSACRCAATSSRTWWWRASSASCAARKGGTVSTKQFLTDKGESISKPVCEAAGSAEPIRLQRSEFVGPQVGKELAEDGAKALAFVVAGIMIYLAFRFEWKFSVAAIVANLHDVVIILGFFAFFQWSSRCRCCRGAGGAGLLGQRIGGHLRPDPRGFPALPQDDHPRGDRPRDHQHHEPHHHHPRLHADDGAVDAAASAARRCTTSRWR
jgi:preprotein translocase subunit SecF